MKGQELMIQCPKATEAIKKWFLERVKDSVNSVSTSVELKSFVEKMSSVTAVDNSISRIIDNNPRALFDVFDKYGIYINILIGEMDPEGVPLFSYSLLPRDLEYDGGYSWYSSRKEAESKAVADAFGTLNLSLESP